MEVVLNFDAGWVAAAGAAIYELSRWASLRAQNNLPAYVRKLHYWLGSLCFILVGFLLGMLLGAESILHALALGLASPVVCARIAAMIKEPTLSLERDIDTQTGRNRFASWLGA